MSVFEDCAVRFLAMKSIIFVVLVASQLLVDAKTVPNGIHKANECAAKITGIGEQDSDIFVTYTPSNCGSDVVDKIEYSVNGGAPEPIDPIFPGLVIISGLELSCLSIKVDIRTFGTDDTGASVDEVTSDEYQTKVPAVDGLTVKLQDAEVVLVSWKPQSFAEDCGLTYKVQYGEDTADQQAGITENKWSVDLNKFKMCKETTITVTAENDNNVAAHAATNTFTRAIDSVKDFEVTREDNSDEIKTTFTPVEFDPDDIEECGAISYSVVQDDGDCFNIDFSIQVVPETGGSSSSANKKFNKGPGKVVGLKHELVGDIIYFTWQAPDNSATCGNNLWYIVRDGDLLVSTHSTTVQVTNPAKACETQNFFITASNGKEGVETIVEVAGHIGEVKGMRCEYDGTNVKCIWQEPVNAVGCPLEYKIKYSIGSSGEKDDTVGAGAGAVEVEYPIASNTCEDVWIQVTPVINEREGIGKEFFLNKSGKCNSPPIPGELIIKQKT